MAGGEKKHTHSFLQSRYALEFSHLVNTKKTPLFSFSFLFFSFPSPQPLPAPQLFLFIKNAKKKKKISTKRVLLFIHENEKKIFNKNGGGKDWLEEIRT